MARQFALVFVAAALLFLGLAEPARAERANSATLVSDSVAMQHGLKRAWVAQVELDRSADRLTFVTQDGGELLMQTRLGMVHVLNSETGRTVWAQQIGERNRLNQPPGANEDYVAVVNGTTLYLVERSNGHRVWEHRLDGVPGSGPVVNDKYVYVPMLNGLMQSYEIAKPRQTAWNYRSLGRVFLQPIITPHTLSWTTDRGFFYVMETAKNNIRFRLETRASIESEPAYWTPYLYACSTDGEIYCVDETNSKIAWRFPAGDPILQPPVAINGDVYVVPTNEKMRCLDGKTGEVKWAATGIAQFVSASPTRIYACDRFSRLVILDAKHGTRLDSMPLPITTKKLINHQSDRIYLTTETGLIQCLHEVSLRKPMMYEPPPEATPETRQQKTDKAVANKAKKADGDEPAATEEAPAGDATEPAAAGSGASDASDDPFGS